MLYRKQRGPASWGVILGAGILGLLLGFLGGRGSAPQPTIQSLLQPAAQHVRQAVGALDIVELEYARALKGNRASQQASVQALAQARSELAQATALEQLYPQSFTQADRALDAAARAIQTQQPQAVVVQALETVRTVTRQFTVKP
ncbi:hypothetical protein [Deinococcus marmoris]|uniref:Uncharacterized protein n=1 Tax=Deinococcus marmoris TaxID=249408 RepID=A0A1U7NWH1_9DEIO|nr:hypothetical protein [Deinococcus marmoris]OLV17259.1 hypothetical protein BOO71_0009391 [Deinococcus marmoris]OLV18680.1 hypothetical protein BOO71_0005080 [Deinococcus marmoris]